MRPKSELTGQRPRQVIQKAENTSGVSVRWTQEHHIMYLRLGGSKWLREQVEKHMKSQMPDNATTQ